VPIVGIILFVTSDEWPPPGPQRRQPTYERIRALWTLHGILSTMTAAIWRNDFGLELRIDHGGEWMESRRWWCCGE